MGEGGGIGRKLRKRKSKTGGTKEKEYRREGRENDFYVFLEKTLLFLVPNPFSH